MHRQQNSAAVRLKYHAVAFEMAALAENALLAEARLTPKPGLVDENDSGSHHDMDLGTLENSARAIKPFFAHIAGEAVMISKPRHLLPALRPIGIAAEKAMLQATGGINSHRGAIFSIGVATAAAAWLLYNKGGFLNIDKLFSLVAAVCRGVGAELTAKATAQAADSHGKFVYRQFRQGGIRYEAERGFPAVRKLAYPFFRSLLAGNYLPDEAAIDTLMLLMATTNDSNLLYRGGVEGLCYAQQSAADFLARGGIRQAESRSRLSELNRNFIKKRLSAGGCADLLALTFYTCYLDERYGR